MILRLLTCVSIAVLTGCRLTYEFNDVGTGPTVHEIYGVDPIDVELSSDLAGLKERLSWIDTGNYKVRNLLHRVFAGSDDSPMKLEFVDSQISVTTSEVFYLGTRWDATYAISVSAIPRNGQRSVVIAVGKGNSMGGAPGAGKEAIEVAVNSLYRQVRALLHDDVTASRNGPAVPDATPDQLSKGADTSAQSFIRSHFEQLMQFKAEPLFGQIGFSAGEKYFDWLESLRSRMGEKSLSQGEREALGELLQLGIEYASSRGSETNFSRATRARIEQVLSTNPKGND